MGILATSNLVSASRRKFLVMAGMASAAGAAVGLFGCSRAPLQHFKGTTASGRFDLGPRTTPKLGNWQDLYRQRWTWDKVAKGSHGWANCRSACEWDLYVKDGVVVREEQSATYEASEPGIPDFNPRGCQKGACYTEVMYGPSRTTVPLKRVGPRGSGKWEKISWEQALREIAVKTVDAAEKWGTDTIYQDLGPNFDFGASTAGRFKFQFMAGGIFADNWAEIGDLNVGASITVGAAHLGGSADEWFLSDFIVVWMMNPSVTQIPDAHFLYEARYNGTELCVIDPQYSATAIHADQWLPLESGTDAALGLAVARYLLDTGAIDLPYIREQTDLPLLARLDTGRFLRESDLKAGGDEDQLYMWHPQKNAAVPAPGCLKNTTRSLKLDFEPPIDGQWKIKLANGEEVVVVPVGAMLKEHLDPWTFEHAAQVTHLHIDQIRKFAEGWAKAERPMVLSSWGSNRYVHSDLMNRTKMLLLMLKGALGKKGAGYQATGWVDLDGFGNAMQMEKSGMTGRLAVMLNAMPPKELFNAIVDIIKKRKTENDVALEGENNYLRNKLCTSDVVEVNLKSEGYRAALSKEQEGLYPRELSDYYDEAHEKGWAPGLPRKNTPKIFFSGGSNLLRRNNLPQYLKAHIWDQMDCIVDVNPKYSYTGTQADYILPAAGWYEKTGIKYTMSYIPYLHYCDAAVPPLAESKGEWEIYWLLTREMENYAKEKNQPILDGCGRGTIDMKTIHQRYTNQGDLGQHDQDKVTEEILRSESTKGMTVEGLRQTGIAKYTATGKNVQATALNNPDWKGEGVLTTLTRFTVHKEPWPTYSGRISSFIDHPWFIEGHEQFATHKDSPKAGGDYPFIFVSCHARWSIHSTWRDTPMMLRLQRGEPLVYLNPTDAAKIGVKDFEYVEIYNNYGSIRMRLKVTAMVRPGVAYYYHAWEPHQFPNHESYKNLIPGIVQPLHYAGGYGHINHALNRFQPGSAVQDTRIGIKPWTGQATGVKPVVVTAEEAAIAERANQAI
ncbi:putative steroid C25 dehydrogenase-like alpha-subunit [Sterolibacterium denitrificans]|uniref:Putative steroid C25 dehydrogenase-like alpha-subunit n=1 Tax=Sterolibacterium denitrificans TaxID=157592 RepID=H9NNA1_9PROT|nr:molybdopterin-dependent oxidoreductase [Sterolibacterium denitrificans]AFF61337.1 putative steroid C25 dehydrogenase-like alpha-subunit [Sterolibacterium denitrificans]SMB22287.1 putative steroid C25 dehydrogenase-like alpha-subunit [Sterolibacterium denitrificans]